MKVAEPEHPPVLVIHEETSNETKTNVIKLGKQTYCIGRGDDADIQVSSQFASRKHAYLVQSLNSDGSYYYRIVDYDLGRGSGSTNGICINGQRKQEHELVDGDVIEFGVTVKATYYLYPPKNIGEEGSKVPSSPIPPYNFPPMQNP